MTTYGGSRDDSEVNFFGYEFRSDRLMLYDCSWRHQGRAIKRVVSLIDSTTDMINEVDRRDAIDDSNGPNDKHDEQ